MKERGEIERVYLEGREGHSCFIKDRSSGIRVKVVLGGGNKPGCVGLGIRPHLAQKIGRKKKFVKEETGSEDVDASSFGLATGAVDKLA